MKTLEELASDELPMFMPSWFTNYGWEVRRLKDKWVVGKWSNEAIMTTSTWDLNCGRDPDDPIEGYWFTEQNTAYAMLDILVKLDPATRTLIFSSNGNLGIGTNVWGLNALAVTGSIRTLDTASCFSIHPNGKKIFGVNSDGSIAYLDLPYLIKGWFKTTKIYYYYNKFMWGIR